MCRGRSLTKTESAKTNLARETLGINPLKYEPLASKGALEFLSEVYSLVPDSISPHGRPYIFLVIAALEFYLV